MNKQFTLPLVLSGLLLLAVSCSQPDVDSNTLDAETEIRAQWDRFSEHWHNEDAAACAAFYANDGINVPSGFVANTGPEAIESFYRFLFDNNLSSVYTHEIKRFSTSGHLAVEYGMFTVNWLTNDSTEWTYKARTLTHWEKESDGQWKIKAFLFNPPPDE